MRSMRKFALLTAVVPALMSGCITPVVSQRPALPERLAGQGLLVAEFRRDRPVADDTQVTINGRQTGPIHRGYLVLPLAPGRYTLDTISDTARGVPARGDQITPIEREFEIRASEVTSLGLFLWLSDRPAAPDQDLAALDNSAAMRDLLALDYPALNAVFNLNSVQPAFGPYASPTALDALRTEIARSSLSDLAGVEAGFADPAIAIGPAGTIARVTRDADGQVISARPYDTGTLAMMVAASRAADRYGFLSADNRLFLLENGQMRTLDIPASLRATGVQVFGAQGVALIDHRMVIHVSTDGGGSWQPHTQFAVELPPQADPIGVHGISDADRFYLYTVRNDRGRPRVFMSPSEVVGFTDLSIPSEVDAIAQLVSKRAGLFLNPVGGPARHSFYFRSVRDGSWERRTIPSPGGSCRLEFQDAEGGNILAVCPSRYRSTDGGRSWELVY